MADASQTPCSQIQETPTPPPVPSPTTRPIKNEPNTTMDREYEFFVTTEEPHQPEGVERGLIRRLVMRNFFETKWAGPQKNSSENNSASTVMAKTQLKNRFRLSKMGEEKREPRSRTEPRDDDGRTTPRRPRASKVNSGRTESSVGTDEEMSQMSRTSSRKNSPTEEEGGNIKQKRTSGKARDLRLILKINPSTHRFDPFDVLPVPGTPQLDTLFKLYKTGARTNSIAMNAKNTWWSFISNDAGLLHATLATWALYGMLVRGLSDLRVDKLRHKNEAIKEINVKIGAPGGCISDQLVGTVLTLASFENLIGRYEAAQLHIAALKRMINARGGLFAFGHNDGLMRGIIWVDFHTAAAYRTPPTFPQIRLDPDTPPLPDDLLEEAACTSPTSLLQLPLASIDCFNVFHRLHRLALATSSQWITQVDRLTMSNLLYETEYLLLSIPDYSREFLELNLDSVEGREEEKYTEKRSNADAASVVEALVASTQIFMYAALREIPRKAKIFGILLDRAQVALRSPQESTITVWERERSLNLLLWVLLVACSVVPLDDGRSWWISMISEVMEKLIIIGKGELEQAVKRVSWTDTFFDGLLQRVWEEVSQLRRERMSQQSSKHCSINTGTAEELDFESQLWNFADGVDPSVEFEGGQWKVDGWFV